MKGLIVEINTYNTVVSYNIVQARLKLWRDIQKACETPKQVKYGRNKGKWKHQKEYLEYKESGIKQVVTIDQYRKRRSVWRNALKAYTTPLKRVK